MGSRTQNAIAARRRKLIKQLDGATMLVTNMANVRYLTGFTGSSAMLLINDSIALFLTDGRYVTQVAKECPDLETEIRPVNSTMVALATGALQEHNVTECFVESDSMTRSMWNSFTKTSEITFLDSSGIVESLRAVKDDVELSLIRRSVEINEEALFATLSAFDSAWTELQFAWHLEREIRQRGGSGFSFDPIVAAGPASALPHYDPTVIAIKDHSMLLVDWGTSFEGYASDLTRVVATADVPEQIQEIHKIVSDAKQAATETVCEGVELRAVDNAARQLIIDAGYGDQFNHGTGHGFGLEIHESPFLSPSFDGVLKSGMVITIEPGIYLPGTGGVRLEDDILVTSQGYERLNSMPDDFLTL